MTVVSRSVSSNATMTASGARRITQSTASLHQTPKPDSVKYSSPIVFNIVTRAEQISEEYRAQLFGSGQRLGVYYVSRFHAEDDLETLPPVLCLVESQ